MRSGPATTPQQSDGYSCGLFTCASMAAAVTKKNCFQMAHDPDFRASLILFLLRLAGKQKEYLGSPNDAESTIPRTSDPLNAEGGGGGASSDKRRVEITPKTAVESTKDRDQTGQAGTETFHPVATISPNGETQHQKQIWHGNDEARLEEPAPNLPYPALPRAVVASMETDAATRRRWAHLSPDEGALAQAWCDKARANFGEADRQAREGVDVETYLAELEKASSEREDLTLFQLLATQQGKGEWAADFPARQETLVNASIDQLRNIMSEHPIAAECQEQLNFALGIAKSLAGATTVVATTDKPVAFSQVAGDTTRLPSSPQVTAKDFAVSISPPDEKRRKMKQESDQCPARETPGMENVIEKSLSAEAQEDHNVAPSTSIIGPNQAPPKKVPCFVSGFLCRRKRKRWVFNV